jgi:hypothetical protein
VVVFVVDLFCMLSYHFLSDGAFLVEYFDAFEIYVDQLVYDVFCFYCLYLIHAIDVGEEIMSVKSDQVFDSFDQDLMVLEFEIW